MRKIKLSKKVVCVLDIKSIKGTNSKKTSEKYVLFTIINKQHVGNYFFNT